MGKVANCRASQANNAPAMRVWMQTVVVILQRNVLTVENVDGVEISV